MRLDLKEIMVHAGRSWYRGLASQTLVFQEGRVQRQDLTETMTGSHGGHGSYREELV
jgi:hypothetical protein